MGNERKSAWDTTPTVILRFDGPSRQLLEAPNTSERQTLRVLLQQDPGSGPDFDVERLSTIFGFEFDLCMY